jgi:taurine dioxygenase
MKIEKITPIIGAEISDIDLSKPLTEQQRVDLKNALLENYVLFFRNQPMDPEYLPVILSQFGELDTNTTLPYYNSNKFIGYQAVDKNTNKHKIDGKTMHADRSSAKSPPRTTMLYITECPTVGGDTIFTNTVEAYNELLTSEQLFFESLDATHISGKPRSTRIINMTEQDYAIHPVIITRPETGKKLIYVNESFTIDIPTIGIDQSNQVLSRLFKILSNHKFSCRFRWSPNTIAWWDNIGTQHQAIADYQPNTRIGFRVISKNLY